MSDDASNDDLARSAAEIEQREQEDPAVGFALSDPTVGLSELSETQQAEAEQFAAEFLKRVLRLRGVRIDREHFLRAELHRRGIGPAAIEQALAENPAAAGIGLEMLDRMASDAVEFETRKSTAVSFAAGLPGGLAMIGTIPGDITQFYVHAFRIMQKVAYVYGWKSFLSDTEDIDDETLGKLAAFLGVMMGVAGASTSVTTFAAQVAMPAVQKKIAGVALTKTAWYTPMKQVLRVIGVKLTKDSFAKAVSKSVPVVGGAVSGSLTYASLRLQSARLIRHLRELPPPNVDAEEYLRTLHRVDEAAAEKERQSLRGRLSSAVDSVPRPRRAQEHGKDASEESHGDAGKGRAGDAVRSAGTAAKGAGAAVAGRVGAVFSRRSAAKETAEADAEQSESL